MEGTMRNVKFADYLKWPYLSQSTLKEGGRDGHMAALRAAIDGERTMEPTDDMVLGSALHVAFLEPEELADRVACWDGERRAGKEWERFKAANVGKYLLTAGRYASMLGMVQSMRRHPWVREISGHVSAVEIACVGDVYGVPMKARADADLPGLDMIMDVKKVRCGTDRAMVSAVVEYGYDIQAAVYTRLFGRSRFVLLTVEDQAPYDVVPYELSPAFIRRGWREACHILDQYKYATKTGVWGGRSNDLLMLDVPEWAVDESDVDGITLGGSALMGGEHGK